MSSNFDLAGVPALTRRLQAIETAMLPAVGATLYQHAQDVMTAARARTPVRNRGGGTLKASGMVLPPEIVGHTVSVTLGFGGAAARYAASVHENERAGKTGGVSPSGHRYQSWAEVGQWHFLSEPVDEAGPSLVTALAATVVRVLRQQTGG